MHGRTYVEKDIGLDLYRKKCMEMHQKKLLEIKSKNTKIEAKRIEDIIHRKHEEKIRNSEFMKQEKDLEVNRNNKKLLEKLVEISKGKHLGVETLTPVNHSLGTSSMFRPKSLNIVSRKKESQKIEEDNFKFAKRLFESHGLISVKEMKEQFKEHVKIKKHVRKLNGKVDKDGKKQRHGLLPPITQNSSVLKNKTIVQNDDGYKSQANIGGNENVTIELSQSNAAGTLSNNNIQSENPATLEQKQQVVQSQGELQKHDSIQPLIAQDQNQTQQEQSKLVSVSNDYEIEPISQKQAQ